MTRSTTAPSAARPPRSPAPQPARPGHRLRVLRSWWPTPRLVRVTFGVLDAPGLAVLEGLDDPGYADRCVRLVFPRPGAARPSLRTYTVRALDRGAGELVVDFVVHSEGGVAGPWAASARPGDEIVLRSTGGSYVPRGDVDAHVLVGDESTLPAVAVACERMPPGVPVHVLLEIGSGADEIALPSLGDVRVRWAHRDAGDDVVTAVRDTPWPGGRVQAFVHGESGAVRALRPDLHAHGVRADLLSISGYWRRGADAGRFAAERRAELRRAGASR